MAWTPKRDSGGQGSAAGVPSPAPRRRRARAAAPEETIGARPEPGRNNQSPYGGGRDDRPRDIKVRLGKRWSEIMRDIAAGEYSWSDFCEGLDPEELASGRLKDRNGTFTGRPPTMVPRAFHLACQRELKRRFELLFSKEVLGIAEAYLQMAQSPKLKEETRAKMLQYAMERVFGGIPKDVTIKSEQPYEQMIVNVFTDDAQTEIPDHLKRRYAGYQERQGGDTDDVDEGR